MTGIAPAENIAPRCPVGRMRLSRKPPASTMPSTPMADEDQARGRLDNGDQPAAERRSGSAEQQQQHARGEDGAALETAARGEVAVDEHIGPEQQDQRHQQPRAGRQQFAAVAAVPEPRSSACGAFACQHQADDGRGEKQHRDLAERVEPAVGDDDRGDDVGRAGILGGVFGVIARRCGSARSSGV